MSAPAASMRVLYIQPGDAFGGAERQAATIVPLLRQHGIDVVPLVGPGDTVREWLRDRGVDNAVVSRKFPENLPAARGMRYLGVPWQYWRARARTAQVVGRLIREHRVELVYAALPFAWASATSPARRLGVPIVWRAGGPQLYAGALGHAVFRPWARRHPPDLIVCSSEAVRATFAQLVPAPLAVVLNGVDLDEFRPAAADVRRAGVTVGFAARLVSSKGIGDVLAAAGRLAVSMPSVRFLIAGEGLNRAAYERRAVACGADRNTQFLGYVRNMRGFYAQCDVFVLPSRAEGCANALLEAMAMGCAIVASDIPGNREVVGNTDAAVWVPANDVDRLHAALARVCHDADQRRAMGAAARTRVRQCFDARVAAAHIAALLHRVRNAPETAVVTPAPRRLRVG